MGEFGGFRRSFPQVTETNSAIGSCVFQRRRGSHDVHVLVVDRRMNFVTNAKELGTSMVAEILKQFSYEVTVVESANSALSILSNGNEKFDVLMANFYQPDKKVNVKLLQEAVKMKLLVVQISDEKDENGGEVARRAIEQGVFLYLEKPFPVDMLKYLWQHVYRERIVMNHGDEDLDISMDAAETLINEQNNIIQTTDIQTATTFATTDSNNINLFIPRKRGLKFKWTEELHSKFMDAVNQLGAGNCYPKEIWEMMKVPGLTREKVASHLQRCRDNKWRPVVEHGNRRSRPTRISTQPRRPRHKKFGLMPVKQTSNNGDMQFDIIAAAAAASAAENDEISSQDGYNNESGSSVTVSTNSVTDMDVGVLESSAGTTMVETNYCDPRHHDRRLLEEVQNNPILIVTDSLKVDETPVVKSSQIPRPVAREPTFDELLNIPEDMLPRIFFGGQAAFP